MVLTFNSLLTDIEVSPLLVQSCILFSNSWLARLSFSFSNHTAKVTGIWYFLCHPSYPRYLDIFYFDLL